MGESSASTVTGVRRRMAIVGGRRGESANDMPARVCHYGEVSPLRTSWTELNPGRRFYGCRNYRQGGGCGYFHWLDDEMGERSAEVINELLGQVDRLYEENLRLRRRGEHAVIEGVEADFGSLLAEVKKNGRRLKLATGALVATWLCILVKMLCS